MPQSAAPELAYHIRLTELELQLVGEITAIQCQIENLLRNTIQAMLDPSTDAYFPVMDCDSLITTTYIFERIARKKAPTDELRALAKNISTRTKELSKGHNDFTHAIYAVARPDFKGVRDEAAKISCALAHFEYCVLASKGADSATNLAAFSSEWLGRF